MFGKEVGGRGRLFHSSMGLEAIFGSGVLTGRTLEAHFLFANNPKSCNGSWVASEFSPRISNCEHESEPMFHNFRPLAVRTSLKSLNPSPRKARRIAEARTGTEIKTP